MGFQGRGNVIAARSVDPVLAHVGCVGLAMGAPSALIVDVRSEVPAGRRTLADLQADGPRLDELSPGHTGIAIIATGAIDLSRARAMVEDLAMRWPAVVVCGGGERWDGPTVPFVPMYPGWLAPSTDLPAAWQQTRPGQRPSGPGPVLPPLSRRWVDAVLGGRHPRPNRWTRLVSNLWEMPWA